MEEELFPRTLAGPRFALLLPLFFPCFPERAALGFPCWGGRQ